MRAFCKAHGKKPHELSFDEIQAHGWESEMIRAVSCKQLKERLLPVMLGGVAAVPKEHARENKLLWLWGRLAPWLEKASGS